MKSLCLPSKMVRMPSAFVSISGVLTLASCVTVSSEFVHFEYSCSHSFVPPLKSFLRIAEIVMCHFSTAQWVSIAIMRCQERDSMIRACNRNELSGCCYLQYICTFEELLAIFFDRSRQMNTRPSLKQVPSSSSIRVFPFSQFLDTSFRTSDTMREGGCHWHLNRYWVELGVPMYVISKGKRNFQLGYLLQGIKRLFRPTHPIV